MNVPEPFVPPPWLRGGLAQTIWANYAPRGNEGVALQATASVVELPTTDGDLIRLHRNTSTAAVDAPVLVVLHGLTGCAGAA